MIDLKSYEAPATGAVSLEIPVVWKFVREIRALANRLLADYPEDLRRACAMTASELVENAIKYGEVVPKAPCARFSMRFAGGQIEIAVTNGIRSPQAIKSLTSTINFINGNSDCEALYADRMLALMMDSSQSGQLGLFRVCCEGGFSLSCEFDGQVVTVKATRGLQ